MFNVEFFRARDFYGKIKKKSNFFSKGLFLLITAKARAINLFLTALMTDILCFPSLTFLLK